MKPWLEISILLWKAASSLGYRGAQESIYRSGGTLMLMVIACPQIVEKYVEALPKKLLWVDLRDFCLGVQRGPHAHNRHWVFSGLDAPCVAP